MHFTIFAGTALALLLLSDANAVSISGKTSDDSVCDLGPDTTYRVTRKVFVPAYTTDLPNIYSRLAMRFIVGSCKNDQTLILHSTDGDRTDDQTFRLITPKLCDSAEIRRAATGTRENPHSFQLSCKITKISDARVQYENEEHVLSTENLIAQKAPRPRTPVSGDPISNHEPCGEKLTAGQLFFGFGGRCADRSR